MKTFIADIIPKIQKFSQKLDNLTLLTNQHWVYIDNVFLNKVVYIFRDNSSLLISTNGKVDKAKWEYIGNKSLLIETAKDSYLFKHGFFDENILALKIDSKDEYAIFVNESRFEDDINSFDKVISFLKEKYLNSVIKSHVEKSLGHSVVAESNNNEDKTNKDILIITILFISLFLISLIIAIIMR